MFEDEIGLGESDLSVRRQLIDDEVAQSGRVGRGDVQEEIVGTGQEIDVLHFWKRADSARESDHPAARTGLQPDRDHRLERAAQCGRIDIRVEAADRTARAQGADPTKTRGRSDADLRGQRIVRGPRIRGEHGEDVAIDIVNSRRCHCSGMTGWLAAARRGRRGPNILRRATYWTPRR
jgi:hypothetical protein